MAESLVQVCSTADIAVNTVKRFDVGDNSLAVYNIGGTFYATDDECTHGAVSLADGELNGDVIECIGHFGAFHVPTGEAVSAPCSVPLRIYKVVVREDAVFVDLGRTAAV